MFLRPKRNRRRVDLAKKSEELKATARHHGPLVLKVLATALVSAGLVYGAVQLWGWATTTEKFALREVACSGNTRASDASLTKLGGITLGANLVALDVGNIERALSAHPWVKSVRVTRRFPSRLEVVVEEHQPVAVIALGELYLVNREGEPFKRVQATEPFDLPLVSGIERDELVARRDESIARVKGLLEVIDAYSHEPGAKTHPLSEVSASVDGVTLFTLDGEEVRLGEGELAQKLARLTRVRHELETRQLSAQLVRLDNRARPGSVTVQTKTVAHGPQNTNTGGPEKGSRSGK